MDNNYEHTGLNLRFQATCMIEAETPLAVGSGNKNILLDNPMIRDAFGLPYIPGTSLTGVMRHTLGNDKEFIKELFGDQELNENKGVGSRIILSAAHLVGKNKQIADGLDKSLALKDDLDKLLLIAKRDHVRINHKGVANKEGYGKFESELLPKGTRFLFDIELWGTSKDIEHWKTVLNILAHPLFRIGSGTRKGFGKFKIVELWERTLDLKDPQSFKQYLDKSTLLKVPSDDSYQKYKIDSEKTFNTNLVHYQLQLKPRDFFLFDGQFDFDIDNNTISEIEAKRLKLADSTPKTEKIITWKNDIPKLSESQWLIPGTSIKGAISHRVAFYYNKNKEKPCYADSSTRLKEIQAYIQQAQNDIETVENCEQIDAYLNDLKCSEFYNDNIGESNKAVKTLFGEALDVEKGQRGKVIFSDVYISKEETSKEEFNHVSIDRFTGGALDSALFSEEVVATEKDYTLDIWVEQEVLKDTTIEKAFEQALDDLANERLPLGGGAMRGHGMMCGLIYKNGERYDCNR